MADKITKLLARLPKKQLNLLLPVIEQLVNNTLEGLDVKSLKGHKDLYRARIGNYRIIFTNTQSKITVLLIAKRNEKTYKDL